MKAGPKALPPGLALPPLKAKKASGRVVEFCETYLTHVKGSRAGEPLILAKWQIDRIIRPLFDTKAKGYADRRQYRTCYVTMPRKSGKSTLGAALALYLLYADGEKGAEIVSAAADTDQARIVFDVARSMVEASPVLRDMTQVYQRELVVPGTGGRYRVISAEAGTKHGMNLSGAICDELHVWTDRALYDVLGTSTGARDQPLIVILTTAGDDEHGICAEVHRHAMRVLEGVEEDPTLLSIVFAAPDDADPWDEAVWRASNPALGKFRSLEEMRSAARQAKQVPGREAAFRRLYLNQWGTAASNRWLAPGAWDACDGPADLDEVLGRPCFVGLDLASNTDIAAAVYVFPFEGEQGIERVVVLPRFWIPRDRIMAPRMTRDPLIRDRLAAWVQQGLITATGGDTIDLDVIRRAIVEMGERVRIVDIGYDRWGANHIVRQLQDDGFALTPITQSVSALSGPMREVERLVLAKILAHGGHPVLRWMERNVAVRADAENNIKPDKQKSSEKIDGIVALIMAVGQMVRSPTTVSVYDERVKRGESVLSVV
jgi:phage terminase large subunit-like protein